MSPAIDWKARKLSMTTMPGRTRRSSWSTALRTSLRRPLDERARAQQVVDGGQKRHRVERLAQERRRTGGHRLAGAVERGDSDDLRRVLLGELMEQPESGPAGEQQIEKHHVRRPFL